MEVLGFIFGIIALGAAATAKAQVAALKLEVDALKAALQNNGE